MSNAPKYRKKAVEYEQLKQFDRAVASYVRAIEENENAGEEVDVALFNKVGDLTLRQGRVTEAVTYYERAVEHYVSNTLFDNAIALCNKILRNAPGRSNVYFTLGRICGRKGLRSDATRNFLEYAKRMQQEGRVDEGMRALAEVADLMPELTEVRRFVEEHAARAGISLAPRRRNTPARSSAQPVPDPTQAFGLSRNLVFLEIDYDTVRAAREKTPPPQRSVVAETVSAVPVSPVAAPRTSSLEDLMIFDPNGDSGAIDHDTLDTTVVDGASILKPYADSTAPVASLLDLEPTELNTTSANVEATADLETNSVTQAPTDSDSAPGEDAPTESPVVVVKVVTVPNFPAVMEDEDAEPWHTVAAKTADVLMPDTPIELQETFIQPIHDIVIAESVETSTGDVDFIADAVENLVDAVDIAAEHVAATPDEDVDAIAEHVDANAEDVDLVLEEIDVVEHVDVIAEGVDEVVEDVDVIAEDVNLMVEHVDVIVEDGNLMVEDVDVIVEDGNLMVEDVDVIAGDLDMIVEVVDLIVDDAEMTSDDFDIVVEAAEGIESENAPPPEHTVYAEVLPSIDFDAMLEIEQTDVAPVEDLQTEDFTQASDAREVVRAEDDAVSELVDEFESSDELPPLIFPMPAGQASRDENIPALAIVPDEFGNDDIAAPEPVVEACIAEEVVAEAIIDDEIIVEEIIVDEIIVDEFVVDETIVEEIILDEIVSIEVITDEIAASPTDIVFLDIPDLDSDAPTLTPFELEAIEAPLTPGDAAFELMDEAQRPDDAAFELLTDATSLPLLPDDLDDLFGDTDIPTAVIAAEATLVASSRCSDLRAATNAEPDNFGLRHRLAEALFEAGDREEAITEFGAALAGAELAGELSDAADIADELVHIAGDDVAHHQKRLELAIRLGDQTRLRAAYLDLADNLVRRGEDLRAKAVYARVLEIDPWDHRARTALGDSAPPAPARPPVAGSDAGHVSLADWLRDDDEPSSTRLRMREPDISGDEQDDFNALLKHFKEGVARSLGEDDYESHYDLGVAYKEMGLLDDAIGEFQMALRGRSNRLATYEALGQCFIEQQSYKVAVTVLSRALHEPALQDEHRVGVLYLLGISCEVLQRFDEARGYFQRVYATDIHFRDVNQRLADLERTVR